jgi:hypothetical protein
MNVKTGKELPPPPKPSQNQRRRVRTPTEKQTEEKVPLRRKIPPVQEWNPFVVAKIAAAINAGGCFHEKTAVSMAIEHIRAAEDALLDLWLEDFENGPLAKAYSESAKEQQQVEEWINRPPSSMKVKELLLPLTDKVQRRLNKLIIKHRPESNTEFDGINIKGKEKTVVKTIFGMNRPEAFEKFIEQMEKEGEIEPGKYRPTTNKIRKGYTYNELLMDFTISEIDICDLIIKDAKRRAKSAQEASNKSKRDRQAKKTKHRR